MMIAAEGEFQSRKANGLHWAAAYIGEPWVPHDNDCWSFCRRVWRERFGFVVPVVDVDPLRTLAVAHALVHHGERANWIEVDTPEEGDAVLMAHNRHPLHVGRWVAADGGGVLHCDQNSGVVFNTRAALARNGWARLQFFRRATA